MSDADPLDGLRFALRLPAHPISISSARCVVRSLKSMLDGETIKRAELVVSEIVTNAIRHGSASADDTIDVEVTASTRWLDVVVRDSGPVFGMPLREPQHGDVGGFGLHIARRVADTVSIARVAVGNEVRVRLSASATETT